MSAVLKTKIRVLLADDHPVVRDGLAAMVNQQADMEVVAEAGDGEEAIALYEQHRPDVMVPICACLSATRRGGSRCSSATPRPASSS
jgi:CheY-like chemotaxis protein